MGKLFLHSAKPEPVRASDAWVDPEGNFYPVPYAGHSQFCFEQGVEMRWLEEDGWVHLSGGRIYNAQREHSPHAATQAQLDTLFDVAMAYQEASHSYYQQFQSALDRLLDEAL